MALKRVIVLTRLNAEQVEKFTSAVSRRPADPVALRRAAHYISLGVRGLGSITSSKGSPCWSAYVEKGLFRSLGDPELSQAWARKTLLRDLYHLRESGLISHRLITDALTPFPEATIVDFASRLKLRNPRDMDYVGTVNVTQEPGAKARFFSSPRLIYQSALNGVFTGLDDLLYNLNEDCCHDQTSAVKEVQRHLSSGRTVYSVDLTSATDTFPLSLQLTCGEALGLPDDALELIQFLSRGRWATSQAIKNQAGFSEVQWSVGQPLGMKPSFALFSCTMHALIRGIAFSIGHSPQGSYHQCGDDHVGFDPPVEKIFIETLESLGVEVSPTKSIISNRVAEFAGFLIRSDVGFRPGKWKSLTQDTAIQYCMDPDFRVSTFFPPAVCKLIDRLRRRPFPYGFRRDPVETLSVPQIQQIQRLYIRNILQEHDTTLYRLTEHLMKDLYQHFLKRTRDAAVSRVQEIRASQLCSDLNLKISSREERFRNQVKFPTDYMVHLSSVTKDWMMYGGIQRDLATLLISVFEGGIETCESHPLVSEIMKRRRCSNTYKLCGALIESSPYRNYSSYSSTRRGFYSLLQRVATLKDVIPSRLFHE
jgi:SHS2 domain-containing protein